MEKHDFNHKVHTKDITKAHKEALKNPGLFIEDPHTVLANQG